MDVIGCLIIVNSARQFKKHIYRVYTSADDAVERQLASLVVRPDHRRHLTVVFDDANLLRWH